VLFVAGCGEAPPAKTAKPIVVTVTAPITDKVTDYQDFTGRLAAIKTVDIRARVTGFVNTANFKEGEVVEEGKVLFEIDPKTYQADLNQALANVSLAKADRTLQEKLADRAEELYSRKAMSKEDYETALAAREKSKANVKAMEAARDKAQLYLNYCRVTAPFTGRVSYRYADPGNLIMADNTILTTLVSEDPVYAYFDVDERTFQDLRKPGSPGVTSWFLALQFPVVMRLANEEEFTHVGTADFIDNRANANTGTVRMRGLFKNPDGMLKSGLFARIRMPLGKAYPAILIPDEALQSDQGRKFVYVVNTKHEVEYRTVELGIAVKKLRVIKKGLTESDQVIVSGMQRVRPGLKVQIKVQPPPKKPDAPLVKLLSRHQEAMARSQESGVRGQKSGIKNQVESKGGRKPSAASP
jgi:RND family efflux transporter MFP subunit